MRGSAWRWAALGVSSLAATSSLAMFAGPPPPPAGARSAIGASFCADCTPAPFPCPPCFACIQTDPGGRPERLPTPECPLPRSAAA